MTEFHLNRKRDTIAKRIARLQMRETALQADADRLTELVKKVKREKAQLTFQLLEIINHDRNELETIRNTTS